MTIGGFWDTVQFHRKQTRPSNNNQRRYLPLVGGKEEGGDRRLETDDWSMFGCGVGDVGVLQFAVSLCLLSEQSVEGCQIAEDPNARDESSVDLE